MKPVSLGGAKIQLTCCDCGKIKITWISQIATSSLEEYRCAPCLSAHRRAHGYSWNKKKAEFKDLICAACGKVKRVRLSQLSTGNYRKSSPEDYHCRECYLKLRREGVLLGKHKAKNLIEVKCKDCGKTKLYKPSQAKKIGPLCISCKNKGERNPAWQGRAKEVICSECGARKNVRPNRVDYYNLREKKYVCMPCHLSNHRKGSENPAWKGGVSFEPYPTTWNMDLKRKIWARDKRTCQVCGREYGKTKIRFGVHHINYNKDDISKENLILLCQSCHTKTNFARAEWIAFFAELLKGRYLKWANG